MAYTQSMLLPVLSSSVSLCFFIGYSLWLWIKKPGHITINNRLSGINSVFTLYYLIVLAIKNVDPWWYIFPIIAAVIVFCVSLIQNKDEEFVI